MLKKALFSVALAGVALTTMAGSDHPEIDWGNKQVGDVRSGYTFRKEDTRALQDDEFENPGILAYDDGETLWNTEVGTEGKSCASCHGDGSESMAGVAPRYPMVDEATGKLVSVEHRINECRTERMGAPAFKWDKAGFNEMSIFVKRQSLDMPINVAVDGAAAQYFEKGKELYYTQVGQLQMSCANCHEDNYDNMIRADHLSQGQINGFPTYRFKWQGVGSAHRRFKGCMENIRATPFDRGGEEFTSLELYVAWRGQGLPVETPAVRN